MARIRTDNVFGTTTDAPLTAGATTMNSAGLANLAAVSGGDEAIITLDPNKVDGAPEIIVVTAHTGSATSATIVRGAFGTAAREHAAGTEWVHGPIASNATSFATAADDQGDYVPLGAWETYTPSNTNVTVGDGTQVARFQRVGRTIHVRWHLTFGSTTAFTGTVNVGLPVAAVADSLTTGHVTGWAGAEDNGTAVFSGLSRLQSATSVLPLLLSGGAFVVANATSPFTWTTSDELSVACTYEAAS